MRWAGENIRDRPDAPHWPSATISIGEDVGACTGCATDACTSKQRSTLYAAISTKRADSDDRMTAATLRCPRSVRAERFVYILKSIDHAAKYYVGVTSDVPARLSAHNSGLSAHTAERRPWRTLVVIEFDEEEPALRFERYLKTGSGREFARRHFRQTVR
jgi:putative endonuclease